MTTTDHKKKKEKDDWKQEDDDNTFYSVDHPERPRNPRLPDGDVEKPTNLHKTLTIIIGFIYFFAVYTSVFLAARDWLAYYMEEDKNLIHFSYPDDDGTSYLCNKRH